MIQAMLRERFDLAFEQDSIIRGDIVVPKSTQLLPAIVLVHGFKGFKDWGFFPALADSLAQRGFFVLRFNFSRNGVGPGLSEFDELDRFRESTLSREVEELQFVVEHLCQGNLPLSNTFDRSQLCLFGHSRGGISVVEVAATNAAVKKIASGASFAVVPQPTAEQRDEWNKAGVLHVENSRTKQLLPLGRAMLEDLEKHPDRVEQSVRKLQQPYLIVHGDRDETVPCRNAEILHSWKPGSTLRIISGANHSFAAKHPFQGMTSELEQLVSELADFFRFH